MAAGIGFSRDAQASSERNRSLRKQKEPFQRAKENQFAGKSKRVFTFKESSPEELQKLRSELKSKRKKETIFQIMLFSIILGLFIWFLSAPIF